MTLDLSEIAPYRDEQVPAAIKALLEEMSFTDVLRFVYPELKNEEIRALCSDINTVADFQSKIAYPAMKLMNQHTITDFTCSGLEDLDDSDGLLYISNHRDIILDSALLNMRLHELGRATTETAIGSNLLKNKTVRHLTKLNKNFTVNRESNRKELYDNSLKLSSYIREAITERHISVWISQREGRAKDGNDRTQQGLLKMLAMSTDLKVRDGFKELHIVPLALSYEYDPCDLFKLRELVKAEAGEKHEKESDEDLKNIVAGISKPKGRVHLCAGPVLDKEIAQIDENIPINDQVQHLAEIIDQHIHDQARLWPNNYIALDLLENSESNRSQYSTEELEQFNSYCASILEQIKTSEQKLARQILLKKYAFPVINQRLVSAHP